ncbi:MAG: autotransporter-associated beta strand repeat-containing protein, partial [Prosthecobacter sp.]|nr:autotransporter-associated beta strand repeat-containing protein [Prosthecobacter sp.]
PANGILSSLTPANQNVNLSDVLTVVKDNTTINALRLGVLQDHDGSGGTINAGTTLTSLVDHHAITLMVDGTLKINSGMISSAYFTVGNTASLSTIILGGTLDFNGNEAIINNQNGTYFTTSGVISTGNLEIRSAITNANGLTKTGLAQVVLDGANTYTGLTTINDGTIFLRHGRSAAGAGGAGNGIVITGAGNLNSGNGIVVGTALAREDIYVGVLAGDQQIMRNDNDVTVWNSNVTIDNVDLAGMPLFTPRIRTDNSATSIINGNIAGGDTPISNDVVQFDSRVVQFDAAGNNVFIMRGQFGDRFDGSGNAIPIADPISLLPTLEGVRTNENEVLRVTLSGTAETNYILDRQYNA